jgi:hypothetical protein
VVPTWGDWYWPTWFVCMSLTLLIPEVYALATNVNNTQSYWVWRALDVEVTHTIPWTAAHFLVFGTWLVVMGWLTFHYFFRLFT